jgi:predicted DNA-binding transcriptional regulator AlpA
LGKAQTIAEESSMNQAQQHTQQPSQSSRWWSYKQIAEELDMSINSVRNYVTKKPGFPSPIRLPSKTGKGHPRWKAKEVIDWVEKHQRGTNA